MRAIDAVRRSGIGVGPDRTIRDAALLMDEAGVGSLAIIEGDRLVGIVTDRDLVRRGLARGLTAEARVDGVMSAPVITISADAESTRRSASSAAMPYADWPSCVENSSSARSPSTISSSIWRPTSRTWPARSPRRSCSPTTTAPPLPRPEAAAVCDHAAAALDNNPSMDDHLGRL